MLVISGHCLLDSLSCGSRIGVNRRGEFVPILLQEVEVINNVQDLLKKTIVETDAQIRFENIGRQVGERSGRRTGGRRGRGERGGGGGGGGGRGAGGVGGGGVKRGGEKECR